MTKIIVGMSGGVDSSVAAALLLEQGREVEGLFMKNWDEDDGSEYCTAIQDLADAQLVADKLQIPLHTANFAAEYWDSVFEQFLTEYKANRTPNPDILCNKEIKFAVFMDYATQLGAEKIATGHYARIASITPASDLPTSYQLLKGLDNNKDQSYFLHQLNQKQLSHSLFPVGELNKPDVRALAARYGFENHNKKDSTGICFIGERRFQDFLSQYLPQSPGPIISLSGERLGEHNGLMYYTQGQRQGLQIGGKAGYAEQPWYVAEKDVEQNTLIIAQGHDHPVFFKTELRTEPAHWISGICPQQTFHCHAKIRHRQTDQACEVTPMTDGTLQVQFESPQRAISPGQYIVLFEDDLCLGGAIIR